MKKSRKKLRLRSVPLFEHLSLFEIVPDARILQCKELLRIDEAAAILRYEERTIYDMVDSGELVVRYPRANGHPRIRTESIRRILRGESGYFEEDEEEKD